MKLLVNQSIYKLVEILDKYTKNIYLVGGALRDILIGYEPSDYDILIDISLVDLMLILDKEAKCIKKNLVKGTLIIIIDDLKVDITSYDGKNLIDNLKQRDFTINSLSYNLITYELITLGSSMSDLKENKIRLNDAQNTLLSDPLRILRGIRIALKYNFQIETNTLLLFNQYAKYLSQVAKERITKELKMIFKNFEPYLFNKTFLVWQNLSFYVGASFTSNINLFQINNDMINDLPKDSLLVMASFFQLNYKNISALRLTSKTDTKIINFYLTYELKKANQFYLHKLYLLVGYELTLNYIYFLSVVKKYNFHDLYTILLNIKNKNVLLNKNELQVNGNDLIKVGITSKNISKSMTFLIDAIILNKVTNQKDELLLYLKNNFLIK